MNLLFPFKMSQVPHPDLPSRVQVCISFIWKAGCMDIQVKVWCGAGTQPSMVSQLDQREQKLTNRVLAMTHGAPAILLTRFGLPDNQRSLCWGCVSSSEFEKLFCSTWVPWFWPKSLTAWKCGGELMEGTKLLPYIKRFRKVKNLAVDSFASPPLYSPKGFNPWTTFLPTQKALTKTKNGIQICWILGLCGSQ